MKQFQFEVKNLNYLRRELARIKRFCSSDDYSSLYFQIFTQLTDFKELKQITSILEKDFPYANYYGFQTFGNIFEGKLGTQKTMIVCSVFELESTKTKLVYIDPLKRNADFKNLDELWEYVNKEKWIKGVELTTSLRGSKTLLPGGPLTNLRDDVQIFGGISCNPLEIADENSYIFSKTHGKSDKAIVALLMGGSDLHISSNFILGWEGLGKSFTITKCDQDHILEIDNKPAFDIYRKYLNIEQDKDFAVNGPVFPLLIEHNGIECIRIPFPSDNKDTLYFGQKFEEGLKVRLSYGDKPTILSHIRNRIQPVASYSPEGIRFYSCAIRRTFWGDDKISSETELFDSIAPTIGCYTHGEILRIGNYLYHLNATMVYALIREGEAYDLDYSVNEVLENVEEENVLAPKLINYVKAVTNELEGQFNSTMIGLASIYKSMFLINLKKKTIVQIDTNARCRKILAEKDGFTEKMEHFLNSVITKDTLQTALDFCNFDTLISRIGDKHFIDCEVKGQTIGWTRAQFVVINRDKAGEPEEFVFTTQGIDEQKKAAEEQQRIIQTLADIYNTMHLFDLKADTCKEVSSNARIRELFEAYKDYGCQEQLQMIMKKVVNEKYLPGVLEFTNLKTLSSRMKDYKIITHDFMGNLNGWTKGSFIPYERDEKGNLTKVLFATQIIDDVKRREEWLMKNSRTDDLTQLLNRRAYEEELKELEKNLRKRNTVIFSLDVNGLKNANDDFGHEAGDELLLGSAECLKTCFGEYGNVYRTGGDEFAAIITADQKTVDKIIERLEKYMSKWSGKLIKTLSISYGYVFTNDKAAKNLHDALIIADKNMYAKKEEYYRKNKGVDRRKQLGAFETICDSYLKILRVNLSKDVFEEIKVDKSEQALLEKNPDKKISKWLSDFCSSGQVHEEDVPEFLAKTSLETIIEFLKKEKEIYPVIYRRKDGKRFKKALLEIIPTKDFSMDNMNVFLFVKDIDF